MAANSERIEMAELLDDAYARGVLAGNSVVYWDLFDTELMGRLTPRPSEVRALFRANYERDPRLATDWFYQFSQDTNYIRTDRIAKDVQWKTATDYGELDITINLSKPEKDPKAIAAAKLDEAMPHPLPADKEGRLSLEAGALALEKLCSCGVCLIGPGLGRGNGTYAVVRQLLREARLPVVLDADGINALEGHIDVLDARQGLFTVLTPHDGEFARLGGDLSGGDRLGAALDFARRHGCCLVLKGHCTITAFPDGSAFLNTTGNPGMAKGGSGDVLGGMILALLGQGLSARQAVPMAVWLHGAAGDRCAEAAGEYGMTPGDLIRALPGVLNEHVN